MVSEFLNLATYTWKPASPPANRCGKLASPLAQAWVCEPALEAISISMDFAGGVVVSMNKIITNIAIVTNTTVIATITLLSLAFLLIVLLL